MGTLSFRLPSLIIPLALNMKQQKWFIFSSKMEIPGNQNFLIHLQGSTNCEDGDERKLVKILLTSTPTSFKVVSNFCL